MVGVNERRFILNQDRKTECKSEACWRSMTLFNIHVGLCELTVLVSVGLSPLPNRWRGTCRPVWRQECDGVGCAHLVSCNSLDSLGSASITCCFARHACGHGPRRGSGNALHEQYDSQVCTLSVHLLVCLGCFFDNCEKSSHLSIRYLWSPLVLSNGVQCNQLLRAHSFYHVPIKSAKTIKWH